MDIDYVIPKDEPPIGDNNTEVNIALYDKWERYNRLDVMFIKTKIFAVIHSSVDQYNDVQTLLKAIYKQFVTSNKTLANTLMMEFSSVRGVCKHITQIRDITNQLKLFKIDMSETFLVHYILNTLS